MEMKKDKLLFETRLKDGSKLRRIKNASGERYSLIIVDGVETWSCPSADEDRMLADWLRSWGIGQYVEKRWGRA